MADMGDDFAACHQCGKELEDWENHLCGQCDENLRDEGDNE